MTRTLSIMWTTLAVWTLSWAAAAQAGDRTPFIVGGQAAVGHEAVGAIVAQGEWFCTGTLIGPRVVLTAAHCLEGLSANDGVGFFLGQDANRLGSGTLVEVASVHAHPDYARDDDADIGVLILARDASPVPVPPRLSPLTQSVVGQDAVFVGFGLTETGSSGIKRQVTIPIAELQTSMLGYATPGVNTCSGDSGGPALMMLDGVVQLVGVTSYGDEDCEFDGYNTRVDVFASWVQGFLDGDVPVDAGGDGGWEGSDGGTSGDFCEEEGWYGDGVCDEDCAQPDPDCEGDDGGWGDGGAWGDEDEDFCELEGWYGDGVCDEDCAQPDPDCEGGAGGDHGDDCTCGEHGGDDGEYGDGFEEDFGEPGMGEEPTAREPQAGAAAPPEGSGDSVDTPRSANPSAGCSAGRAGVPGAALVWAVAFIGLVAMRRRRSATVV